MPNINSETLILSTIEEINKLAKRFQYVQTLYEKFKLLKTICNKYTNLENWLQQQNKIPTQIQNQLVNCFKMVLIQQSDLIATIGYKNARE